MTASPIPARLFVISAPSGAGKTSLVTRLAGADAAAAGVHLAHHAAAAPERGGRARVLLRRPATSSTAWWPADAFLEHARVFDNQYGTGRRQLRDKLAAGHDVVLEIDWQGARQVRARPARVPHASSSCPRPGRPCATRLTGRGTDSPAVIERRLADAVTDMSHYGEFDYVMVNDDFDRAVDELVQVVVRGTGSTLTPRRPELSPVLANLLAFPIP